MNSSKHINKEIFMNPNQPVAQQPNPGKGLGIASFVISLVGGGLIGLILGIIAKKKSKAAGQGNRFAVAGIIIGVINIIAVTLIMILVAYNGVAIAAKCNELGVGTHVVEGVTYNCETSGSSSIEN
jgi:predicted permease